MENKWSKSLQDLSVDVLWNGRCFVEPCRVKHWRNDNSFGTVSTIKGICENVWEVVTEDGTVEKFNTVEEMVASGWVVD